MSNITVKEDEIADYVWNNFKPGSLLEISYNRVFIPGEVIHIDNTDDIVITLRLKGELLNQTIEVNINDIKDELIEIRHTFEGNVVVISIIN